MFSAREVSRLAGFAKPWMLNHLEREDIFLAETPRSKHHGKYRTYTFRDLVVLRAINRLLALGARPKRIKAAIETFASVCPEILGDTTMAGIQVKFASEAGHFIVTRDNVLYCRSPEELIDLLQGGQLAFSFMMDNQACTLPCISAACEVVALTPEQRKSPESLEIIAQRYAI